MPEAGVALKPHSAILSYEKIALAVTAAVKLGIRKVRITGGEPLIRRGIECLVGNLAAIPKLGELCMTTNGTCLAHMAHVLKQNGLQRINISLDTLDPEKYRRLTRGGEIGPVLKGIAAALEAGLAPVKINMVILENTGESEVREMADFCAKMGLELQKIMQFSLYDRADLSARFKTERPPNCASCNRLRLTADGFIKPCLFSEHEIPLDFENLEQSFLAAIAAKPENGSCCRNRTMSMIGG